MNALSMVYIFKIVATIVFWCIPLLFFPSSWLLQHVALITTENGSNNDDGTTTTYSSSHEVTIMFLRLLGWAYLSLCVGYGFGLYTSMRYHRIELAPIVVGLVSNGGACLWLLKFATLGSSITTTDSSTSTSSSFWVEYHVGAQFILWSSIIATAFITLGLYLFGWKRYWAGMASTTAAAQAIAEQEQQERTGKVTIAMTRTKSATATTNIESVNDLSSLSTKLIP